MKQLTQYEANHVTGGTVRTVYMPNTTGQNQMVIAMILMSGVVGPFIKDFVSDYLQGGLNLVEENMNIQRKNLSMLWSIMNGSFSCCHSAKKAGV